MERQQGPGVRAKAGLPRQRWMVQHQRPQSAASGQFCIHRLERVTHDRCSSARSSRQPSMAVVHAAASANAVSLLDPERSREYQGLKRQLTI